ncbi:MAG: hypothetical protein LOY58_00275 [Gammaproteobacteria bacterium]|nr:hypothetical protein [Gammaproteobacteria bacterium]
MKSRIAVFVCALSAMQIAAADTVVGTAPDTIVGKGIGGMSGFLVGGAVAGPLGAIGVGLASLWLGGEVQEATGLHDEAYVVQHEDGTTETVRSPNTKVAVGEEVRVEGRRLVRTDVRAEAGSY